MFKSKELVINPFAIQPNPNLIGTEDAEAKIKAYIQNGDICFLNGPAGVGKSSMMEKLRRSMKKHMLIYLDAKSTDEYFMLQDYVRQNQPFWRRVTKLYPKNMVFLLDEAQAADTKIIDELEIMWNKKVIKSIVIAQIKPHLPNCPESFMNRLGKRTVRLDKLNLLKVNELIKMRAGNNHPFTDDAIEIIAEKAGYIPRKVLENCEVLLVELNDKQRIDKIDAKFVLEQKENEELEIGVMELEDNAKPDETSLIPLETIDKIENVSPMEIRILKLLLENGKTAIQLATILNTSVGSVGKQLSKLLKSNYVEVVNNRRPKVYGLTRSFKINLMQK